MMSLESTKDLKLLKKYEIEQKEERFIAIAEKSGRFTFILTLVIEFVAIFMLILIRQNMMATVISTVAAIQTLAYLPQEKPPDKRCLVVFGSRKCLI